MPSSPLDLPRAGLLRPADSGMQGLDTGERGRAHAAVSP